jgi:hypothetical protein
VVPKKIKKTISRNECRRKEEKGRAGKRGTSTATATAARPTKRVDFGLAATAAEGSRGRQRDKTRRIPPPKKENKIYRERRRNDNQTSNERAGVSRKKREEKKKAKGIGG